MLCDLVFKCEMDHTTYLHYRKPITYETINTHDIIKLEVYKLKTY